MCKCAIAHFFALWKSAKKVWSHNRSFEMSECAIAHFAALYKCANVRSHIFLLFENVWKNVQSHIRSFEKSGCAKNVRISKSHFFHKKRAIAHFQNVRLPNLVQGRQPKLSLSMGVLGCWGNFFYIYLLLLLASFYPLAVSFLSVLLFAAVVFLKRDHDSGNMNHACALTVMHTGGKYRFQRIRVSFLSCSFICFHVFLTFIFPSFFQSIYLQVCIFLSFLSMLLLNTELWINVVRLIKKG